MYKSTVYIRRRSLSLYPTSSIVIRAVCISVMVIALAQPAASSQATSDEDLLKILKLFDHPFPASDIMLPFEHVIALTALLDEGVDPFPVLQEIAFDYESPWGKRQKAIAWLGEMANPDTRKQPDARALAALHTLFRDILTCSDMQGSVTNTLGTGPPMGTLIGAVFTALSCTKDEAAVDMILPMTTSGFWTSDKAPEMRLPPHGKLTSDELRTLTIRLLRMQGIDAISYSGTERALEIFATGDELDLSDLGIPPRKQFLDTNLERAILRMMGYTVVPNDMKERLPEEKRREFEEIRKRVETQYLPLRKKSTD